MKSKQLANVLIKILGLSVCIHAIPGFLSNILSAFYSSLMPSHESATFTRIMITVVAVGVEMAVGIFFIINSRKIAEFLFKGEED